jgi:hypothetical protein
MPTYDGFWTDGLEGSTNNLNAMTTQFGAASARPAHGKKGVRYFATDTLAYTLDDGTQWLDISAIDGAAGVASRRTLGTGATQGAAGNHTHQPSSPHVAEVTNQNGLDTDDESVICTTTFTPQAAGLSIALVGTLFQLDGAGNTYTARLKHGTTVVDSVTPISPADNVLHLMQGLQTTAAESSTVYTVTIQRISGGAGWGNTAATLVAREIVKTT